MFESEPRHGGWNMVMRGGPVRNGRREVARLWNTQGLAVSVWRQSEISRREAIERLLSRGESEFLF